MKKRIFHKVITRITDNRNTIKYDGIVLAYELPTGKCEETETADIYEDYFRTKEEAMIFIGKQRKILN